MRNVTSTKTSRPTTAGPMGPTPSAVDSGLTVSNLYINMSLPMLLGVGTSKNYSQSPMDSKLHISTLSFNMSLPLIGVGAVTLLLSMCFCCYLWKLKRQSQDERGYRQLKYYQRSKKVKNDMCPVCLEEFERGEKLAVSPCRHGFHTKCLQQWLDQHDTCPMCKAHITSSAGERTGLITSNV